MKSFFLYLFLIVFVAGVFFFVLFNRLQNTKKESLTKDSLLVLASAGINASFLNNEEKVAFKVEKDNSTASFEIEGSKAKLETKTDKPVYLTKDYEVRYKEIPNGIKEEIILNSFDPDKLGGPESIFSLDSSGVVVKIKMFLDNLMVSQNADDLPIFFDEKGNYRFHFEKPFAKDSKGETTYGLNYEIKKDNSNISNPPNNPNTPNRYLLTLNISKEWLTDKKRVFPIIIDPTIVYDPQNAKPEIEPLRNERTRTFDLGNGRKAAKSGFFHYKDETGQWNPVETEIQDNSRDPDYNYQNITNNVKTYFKKNLNNDFLKFAVDDKWVKFQLSGAREVVGLVNGSILTYPDVYNGIDLRYTLTKERTVEDFIIKNKEATINFSRLDGRMTTSGILPEKQPDGSINFIDTKTKEVLFTAPKPVMYEQNGFGKSGGIVYEISCQNEASCSFSKVLTREGKDWLNNPERMFPVVIDPSTGPNYPSSGTVETSIGSVTWTTPENITADDSDYAVSQEINSLSMEYAIDYSVKLIKGGVIDGEDKKNGVAWTGTDEYISYGGSSDLWGLSWTALDVSASDFGAVMSAWLEERSIITYYLKGSGFGFSIPEGSEIQGILLEVKRYVYTSGSPRTGFHIFARVNTYRITVTYGSATTPSTSDPSLKIQGVKFKPFPSGGANQGIKVKP